MNKTPKCHPSAWAEVVPINLADQGYYPATYLTGQSGHLPDRSIRRSLMRWKVRNVEELRMRFISAWQTGDDTMTELRAAAGSSRDTGYRWRRAYEAEGLAGLPRARLVLQRCRGLARQVPRTGRGGPHGPRYSSRLVRPMRMAYLTSSAVLR